jgi:hypothetical protein
MIARLAGSNCVCNAYYMGVAGELQRVQERGNGASKVVGRRRRWSFKRRATFSAWW